MVSNSKIKFLENFDFSNENVYILGGSGLLGQKVSELFLNLPATSWVGTLKDSITYFESTEEYEECAYAKIVLERITQ